MHRKEFITKLGAAAALAVASSCLCGCVKMDNPAPPVDPDLLIDIKIDENNVDFTLDLSSPKFSPLLTNGGFVIIDNKCVVARNQLGEYVAATRTCSDQQLKGIVWSSSINQWHCVEHDATFDVNGGGTTVYNNLGVNGIVVYNTQLQGNLLRVFA